MKFIINFILLFLVSFALNYAQIDRTTDIGYKYYHANQYEKAIEYWESIVPKENAKYTLQAKYLIGLSHLEISSLCLMASEIVSNTQVTYYDFLLKNKNINKDLVNFYKSIALFESGQSKLAKNVLNKINTSKLDTHHKGLLKIWQKSLSEDKGNNSSPFLIELFRNNGKNFANENIMIFQKSKFKIYEKLKNDDLLSAKKSLENMDLKSLNYTDNSVKSREIRFYDPEIYLLLNYYNLLKAEKLFLELSKSSSSSISLKALETLSEIYFLLGKTKECQLLANNYPNNETINVYLNFSKYLSEKENRYISTFNKIKDTELKSKIGFYFLMFHLDDLYGSKLIESAFRLKAIPSSQFNMGYALLRKGDDQSIVLAEGLLDNLYSRSRTTDFEKNKPILSLLYSYAILKKSPSNSCPESIGISQLLASNLEIFAQYHNAMQGICLYYSTLGEGDVKFD